MTNPMADKPLIMVHLPHEDIAGRSPREMRLDFDYTAYEVRKSGSPSIWTRLPADARLANYLRHITVGADTLVLEVSFADPVKDIEEPPEYDIRKVASNP